MKGFFDTFTGDEHELMTKIVEEARGTEWDKPILSKINANGRLIGENMSCFFELGFGYALREVGIEPRHEVPGEAESMIDFGFEHSSKTWNVELLRLEETNAAKAATSTTTADDGTVISATRLLRTGEGEQKQSIEGETLKTMERICQKPERDGKPSKFLTPDKAINVLLVDFQNFARGGDRADRLHVALGGKHLPGPYRLHWRTGDNFKIISGAFSPETNLKGSRHVRERLHLIGFANEREFKPGSFGKSVEFVCNPQLLKTRDEISALANAWPLKESVVLN